MNAQHGWYSQPGKNGLIAGALDGRPLAATPDSPQHLPPRPVNRRRVVLLLTLAVHLLLAVLYLVQRGVAPAVPSAPQRVVIERINRDGACYTSGVVNFAPGVPHAGGKARAVPCPPSGSGWSRK